MINQGPRMIWFLCPLWNTYLWIRRSRVISVDVNDLELRSWRVYVITWLHFSPWSRRQVICVANTVHCSGSNTSIAVKPVLTWRGSCGAESIGIWWILTAVECSASQCGLLIRSLLEWKFLGHTDLLKLLI